MTARRVTLYLEYTIIAAALLALYFCWLGG